LKELTHMRNDHREQIREEPMKRAKCITISCVIFCIALVLIGCSFTVGDFVPNNKFAFPNSNVEPIGFVSAEVTKIGFFNAVSVDKAFLDEVMSKALKEKGGDLLINYKWKQSSPAFLLYQFTRRH